MTYREIRENEEVLAFLKKGNDNLGVLGFTEHEKPHCSISQPELILLPSFPR